MREVRFMAQKMPVSPPSEPAGDGLVFLNNRILLSLPDAERISAAETAVRGVTRAYHVERGRVDN
jgi:hypothetical protein